MSEAVQIALIMSVPTFVLGCLTLWRQIVVEKHVKAQGVDLHKVEVATNSLQEKMVVAEKKVSHAEGVVEGQNSMR